MTEEEIQFSSVLATYRACYWKEQNPTTVLSFPVIGFSKSSFMGENHFTPIVFYPFLGTALPPITSKPSEKSMSVMPPLDLSMYPILDVLEEYALDFSKYKFLGIYNDENIERDRILVSVISKLSGVKFTRVTIIKY